MTLELPAVATHVPKARALLLTSKTGGNTRGSCATKCRHDHDDETCCEGRPGRQRERRIADGSRSDILECCRRRAGKKPSAFSSIEVRHSCSIKSHLNILSYPFF